MEFGAEGAENCCICFLEFGAEGAGFFCVFFVEFAAEGADFGDLFGEFGVKARIWLRSKVGAEVYTSAPTSHLWT